MEMVSYIWEEKNKGKRIDSLTPVHREIVPPRETVTIARVAIVIVGRGG